MTQVSSHHIPPVWVDYSPRSSEKMPAQPVLDSCSFVVEEEDNAKKCIPSLPLQISVSPKLASPETVKSKGVNHAEANLERDILRCHSDVRATRYEAISISSQEVVVKQKHRHDLHAQLDKLHENLAKRAKTSKYLSWLQIGSTVALVIASVASFALAIVTGGISAILGALTATAAAANGIVGASNGFLQLDSQKQQGEALELRERREMEHTKIDTLLSDSQVEMQRIHNLWMLSVDVIRNRSNLKIFE